MGRTRDITERANQRYLAERDNQAVVTKCLFCDEKIAGTFAETRVLAEAHRKKEHPQAKQRTNFGKKRGGIRTIGARTLGENIAINRAQGASGWATPNPDQ